MSNQRTKKSDTKKKERQKGGRRLTPGIVLFGIVLIAVLVFSLVPRGGSAGSPELTDVRQQTEEFMAYNKSLTLTPDQEIIKREALSGLAAPCCSDRTAYTCCCNCNMAQAWWGLSKHLIVNEGYDAQQVRAAVEDWFEFINPDGFSGNACYTGGCAKPFSRNGCGGMDENKVVL